MRYFIEQLQVMREKSINLEFRKVREDDHRAFQSIFDQWYTSLCRHAAMFVGDHQAAEDIVQDLFINMWVKRKALEITTSTRSYLYRAVRNRCLNYIRDSGPVPDEDYDLEEHPMDEDGEERESAMMQLHARAQDAIGELPERCREIFWLSRNTRLTNREIAGKLGLSEKTIENQITIALRKLRDQLGPHLNKLLVLGWYLYVVL